MTAPGTIIMEGAVEMQSFLPFALVSLEAAAPGTFRVLLLL
jgi:hypothetical protein